MASITASGVPMSLSSSRSHAIVFADSFFPAPAITRIAFNPMRT